MPLIIRMTNKNSVSEGKTLEAWMNLKLEGYTDKEVQKVIEVWKGRGWTEEGRWKN